MQKGARVLLLDDDRDFVDAMAFFLRSHGYEVHPEWAASEVLARIKAGEADIVFLDYAMPGMDGLRVLRAIRDISPDIPVVIVTAYSGEIELKQLSELGIEGIFPKTDNFIKLEQIIEVVLRTHKKLKAKGS